MSTTPDPRFDVAMHHAPVGMAIVAPDGGFLEVNPALSTMLGRTHEELLAASWQDITHPDDLEIDTALVQEVLDGRRDSYRLAKRYLRPDGSVVSGELSVGCVRDGLGAVQYFVSQIIDRTERDELVERYRLLAENVTDIITVGNNDGVVTWVSPSVTALLGWTPEEYVGTLWADFVHPDDLPRVRETQRGVLEGRSGKFEARVRTAAGDHRWMNIRVKPVFDAQGVVIARVAGLWDAEAEHAAGEAFARSQSRYRAALEAQSDPHVFMEAVRDDAGTIVDFRYTDANPLAVDYLGVAGELRGRTMGELFPSQLGSPLFARYVETVETGRPLAIDEFETFSVVLGGTSYFDFRGVKVDDGLSLSWRVVTQRVQARRELAESERQLRLLAENASDAVFRGSPDAVIEWISESVSDVLGGAPGDYIGHPVSEFLHPDDLDQMRRASGAVNQGDRVTYEARARTPSGWRWVEVTARPVREAGVVVARVGSLRDVHERVVAEQAVVAAEAAFRLLAEHANDVVLRVTLDRLIDRVVGATFSLLGREEDELIGLPVTSLFVEDDIVDEPERLARLAAGERIVSRVRVRRPDGSTRWVDRRSSAALAEDGTVQWYVSSLADADSDQATREALAASERQAHELAQRYERARNEALDASREKTVFLSRMSHELRTPLNAILGFAQLLAMDELTADQADAVHQIRTGGRHLLELIGEILDISRIESGRLSLSMESVAVGDAVSEALDLVRPLAEAAGVTVVRADGHACDRQVWADRQRVIQILLNLLSNGVKYNHRGGTVEISCEPVPGELLAIRVADSGPGLSPDQIAHIFDPFDRLGAERTGVEGTGIGLTLSEALARLMSGRLEVTSEQGAGSVFSLVLPSSTLPTGDPIELTTPTLQVPVGSVRVLHIEDNPANIHLMERIAGLRAGVALRVATSGTAGIEAAAEEMPDLVLLDLHLPDMRGEAVLAELRGLPGMHDVPVVVVTADASAGLAQRLTGLGADAVLTKPIDVGEVLGWFDRTIGGSES